MHWRAPRPLILYAAALAVAMALLQRAFCPVEAAASTPQPSASPLTHRQRKAMKRAETKAMGADLLWLYVVMLFAPLVIVCMWSLLRDPLVPILFRDGWRFAVDAVRHVAWKPARSPVGSGGNVAAAQSRTERRPPADASISGGIIGNAAFMRKR